MKYYGNRDGKTLTNRNPLLPQRHGADLFVCDILDATPKGDMTSMEHPLFSLSTKADMKVREYRNGEKWLTITPSTYGLATVHDRDVLIYCISQCMSALNNGRSVTRTLEIDPWRFLQSTNRMKNAKGNDLLRDALRRLAGTRVETNITVSGEQSINNFGLIDAFNITSKTDTGRIRKLEVTLSDWIFDAIQAQQVLTMSPQYFQLRKPIERRLYELARKHCGKQAKWEIGLDKLKLKTGSASTDKEFKRLIQNVLQDASVHDHMPDYTFILEDGTMVVRPKSPILNAERLPSLDPDTYEIARRHAAGWDIRVLESEWRLWVAQRKLKVRNPDANFIKFCKTRGAYEDTFI